MGKVFTITEGLENLGALKTGGQGSVYKGKRIGEIISAVKLLPTPIVSEDPGNKQYMDFSNEVNKLKRVNEEPNPNVVRILGSGITETGGFPFIEMEFIEGPDLGELLQPPHDKIFTIKETIRVAEHVSNALAHCHKKDVKHGDIKSNNIKFNRHTGNYVILDFGMAVMSDEQRRTSLRHAGAIEFMAPEQNEGRMFFQTDIYSFGIILFELLTGQVPFPLDNNSETARNHIMLAHMESPVPDLVLLRKNNLPENWSEQKKEEETLIPAWLTHLIYKCLEKLPENRFENGDVLHEYICLNHALLARETEPHTGDVAILKEVHNKLLSEKEALQEQLVQQQKAAEEKESELILLRNSLQNHTIVTSSQAKSGVSRSAFSALVLLTIILASLAAYGFFFRNTNNVAASDLTMAIDSTTYNDSVEKAEEEKQRSERIARDKTEQPRRADTTREKKDSVQVKPKTIPVDTTSDLNEEDSIPDFNLPTGSNIPEEENEY